LYTFRGGKGQLSAVALSSSLLVLSFAFLPAGLQIKGAMSHAEYFGSHQEPSGDMKAKKERERNTRKSPKLQKKTSLEKSNMGLTLYIWKPCLEQK